MRRGLDLRLRSAVWQGWRRGFQFRKRWRGVTDGHFHGPGVHALEPFLALAFGDGIQADLQALEPGGGANCGFDQHAQARPHDNDGVVLAATAGAVDVQLDDSGVVTAGSPAQVTHLRAVVGLVWRTVVMWMVFLALISAARVLG
jgi:hypothetical protein